MNDSSSLAAAAEVYRTLTAVGDACGSRPYQANVPTTNTSLDGQGKGPSVKAG